MLKIKSMLKKLSFLSHFILFLIISLICDGQIAIGQWRDHLPYNQGEMIAISDQKVYLVTNVGMFSYSLRNGEIQKLSKISGLSDSGVKSIAYDKDLKILVVGYSNGNIDLITENIIFNIPDIKRKSMTGDKTIYNIMLLDEKAYLACGFGIVELDIVRKEIRNTFLIGDMGTFVKVNQLAHDGVNIYAATDNGIYMGNRNSFLVDFANWQVLTNINSGAFVWMKNSAFNHMTYFNDKLIVNYYNPDIPESDTLLIYDGFNWSHLNKEFNRNENLYSNAEQLIISSTYWIGVFNSTFDKIRHIDTYNFEGIHMGARPAHTIIDKDGNIWIADKRTGMVSFKGGWKYERYQINGPLSNKIFKMQAAGNVLTGVAGGMNLSWMPTWNHAMFYRFTDENWLTQSRDNNSTIDGIWDLVSLVVNPKDTDHFYAGSWLSGLVEIKNNQVINVYNHTNSTIGTVGSGTYCRVGGLNFDSQDKLWLTNSLTTPPISVMDKDGNWTGLDYTQISNTNLGEIIITKDNIKWVIIPRGGGLFVFDDRGTPGDMTDDRFRLLSVRNEFGEIISNEIFSIAEDKSGYIWVGTNKGIAVYYNPENVFDDANFHARQIKIPRNDGTDNADILLGTEIVTTINVDGANRKWFGTQSAGVFYTSPDGIEQIHHFNSENSPLLDDNILCLTISPVSGEVFFGTNKGIISYRATATEGADDYHKVYAFPNPVKPDYHGPITITGLVSGSYIKITDISGNLVFETRSEGGQAVWNGLNLIGNRVKTGVYLVLSTNEDGSKTDITKILFIN